MLKQQTGDDRDQQIGMRDTHLMRALDRGDNVFAIIVEGNGIDLATHDSGGITALDVTLARSMEELAARQLGK